MSNPLKKLTEQYFYFSKKDRNAILILIVLILISISAIYIVDLVQPKSKYDYAEYAKLYEEWENQKSAEQSVKKYLFEFNPNTISAETMDSLDIPESIKQNIIRYRNAGGQFLYSTQIRKIYGMTDSIYEMLEEYVQIPVSAKTEVHKKKEKEKPIQGFFDPNHADFNTLTRFGFNSLQANNLIEYRKKGGSINLKNDLLKIYGIDSMFLNSFKNNIQITPKGKNEIIKEEWKQSVEINSADSATLVQLSGIGPVFAGRIIKYRKLLGGFYSKSQLLEVYNFPIETFQKIEGVITVDTLALRKIRINFAEFNEMIKHPYINKQQVEAILGFREKKGSLATESQLRDISGIDDKTFLKIRPYITCR